MRLNAQHPAHVTPSWYGDSVGHYEGDMLVIDTVGFKKGPFAMLDFYGKTPSPRTVVVVEHDGDGAFSRVPEDATAFGHRNWRYNLVITTMWTNSADTDANIRWTREFFDAMQPFRADAAYVNYLGDVTDDGLRAAYGRKYEKLAALKDKFDPTNFFSMNQNIKPTHAAKAAAPR